MSMQKPFNLSAHNQGPLLKTVLLTCSLEKVQGCNVEPQVESNVEQGEPGGSRAV